MPAIRTTPGRTVLAILAGAVSAPIFVVLALTVWLSVTGTPNSSANSGLGDVVQVVALMSGIGIVIGGPVALAAILILFGPLWVLHRRLDGGPWSFIGLAGFAGLLMVGVTAWAGRADDLPDALATCIFVASAALSGAVMWLVAYAGGRPTGIDVRTLPQANFTASEPS